MHLLRIRQWQPALGLLPGKSHGRKSLVGCSPWGLEESDRTEQLHFSFSLSCIEEGNDNPLQCSCLFNPRDGAAWWTAVYGVGQSWTRLKRLSSSSMHLPKVFHVRKRVILKILLLVRDTTLDLFFSIQNMWNLSSENMRFKISRSWASLVVQWLRLGAPNSGDLGSVPGQGTRSHMPQLRVPMLQLKLGEAK